MARLTITVPDRLADQARDAAGGNVSGWITGAIRSRLLAEDARALAAWQAAHPEATAAAYAEAEAEYEAATAPARGHRAGDAA
ncbi:hypothetical protein ACFROC_18035 [Nocardia tengchongensis]|uniref:hypothetical protein n=1 Tax=Nocardia tengchongensis TaxID=2055889 RepID=UPI0036B7C93E